MAETIKIGGELESTATGNVVAAASAIKDKVKNKYQGEINAETDASLALHESRLNALTEQNYVTVDSFNGLPATGAVDTIYRVSNWDGTQQDPSVYSEYGWDGSQYVHLSTKTQVGEVFDISAYHATGGELAKYADLTSALDSNNGGGVPQSLQKGGMSVKFVQTSDNKYVQYRLMSDTFSTTVANWQGVDDEPTAGSNNLVKSGGIDYNIKKLSNKNIEPVLGYYIKKDGTVESSFNHIKTIVKAGDIAVFSGNNSNSSYCYTAALIPDDGSDTVVIVETGAASNFVYKVTTDGTLYVNFSNDYLATSYLKFTNPEYELINELYAERGNVTYDDGGNILSYPVKWSSGATGTYTNTDWDAANNMYKGYEITYSTLMKLVQPAVTVNNGKITNIPNKTIIEL